MGEFQVFVDENIKISRGDDANLLLVNENDSIYFIDNKGITKVPPERWEKAQRCEKNHWFVRGINKANDRNDYHFYNFDGYIMLKKKKFNSVIEIGCGPFTNLRLISNACEIMEVSLLDPMVREYINHPYCSYDEKYLFSDYAPIIGCFLRKRFAVFFKIYRYLLCKKYKIKEVLNIPAEEITCDKIYDMVVMINVIEHCYDMDLVFKNILEITEKGSYFVFEDKLYDQQEVKGSLYNFYDAAHPLKIDKNLLLTFLLDHFDIEYKRIQSNFDTSSGEKKFYDDIYFVGIRK